MTTAISSKMPITFNIAQFESDTLQSLYSIIQDYKEGLLVKAPHQREFKWTNQKVLAFNRGIVGAVSKRATRPTGVFVTYQVPGDNSIYLNDGFQRLTAASFILTEPKRFGIPPEQAIPVLKAFNMPIQHRFFESHFEALLNFQEINFGTPLTGYEFCAGFLMDMPKSDTNWRDFISELHTFLFSKLDKFIGPSLKQTDLGDNKVQFALRQDYALFCRFLTNNKTLSGGFDTITLTQPSIQVATNAKTVEQQLRIALDNSGIDKVLDCFQLFKDLISTEIGLILEIQHQVKPELDGKVKRTLMRFLLNCAIYRRNNNISLDAWKLFLLKLFRFSSPYGEFFIQDGENSRPQRLVIAENKFTRLSQIGKVIGFDLTQAAGKDGII